ncbi:MAG: MobC family plasmid mobilization relaxosome protein [Rhodobacteraceae bacterium]|nr:MobC family plasmid mobilization relaxosome protein [Paracoccaceae bacterium]
MNRSENIKAAIDIRSAFQGEAQAVPKQEKPSQSPITLRVTDEERERLKSLAAGMSVSAYIRKCIFAGDATRRKRRSHMPVKDQEAMARALALLGASRIANNLNQLAHQANIGSLIMDENTCAQIDETYAHVRLMRDELVSALGLIEG